MKRIILILAIFAGFMFIFNSCEKKVYVVEPDTDPPSSPKGVYSITGDESIFIDWESNDESDFKNYKIYWTLDPDDGFSYMVSTTVSQYTDLDVNNGITYYYIITAEDYSGNESEPSKIIYDTPRPEGYNERLYDMAVDPNNAGFYFGGPQGPQVVSWDDPDCDIYLDKVSGIFYLNATEETEIQDFGYTDDFDEINVAPTTDIGWSELGYVEVILGHTYIIRIWDNPWENYYAKLRITSISDYNNYINFEWAYQTAEGNPELKPVPKRIANPVDPKSDK